jgi:O-antigen ligase
MLWAAIITGFLAGRAGGSINNPGVLVRWLAIGSGVLAIISIVNFLIAPSQILFWPKTTHLDRLTGTFRSANTAAAFFGAAFCLAGGALLQSARSRRYRGLPPSAALLRLSGDRSWTVMALLSTGFAAALTQSRGGLLSLIAGMVALAALAGRRRADTGRRSRRGCALVLVGAALAIVLAIVALLRRIGGLDFDEDPRMAAFAMMWRAFKASPVTGWGAGAFEDLVRRFATGADFMALNGIGSGHNIYLQSLAETGVVGTAALVLAIGALLWRSLAGQARDQVSPAARAGLIGALVVMLTQGLADYALEVPAMSVVFALLLGAASSPPARRSSGSGSTQGAPDQPWQEESKSPARDVDPAPVKVESSP